MATKQAASSSGPPAPVPLPPLLPLSTPIAHSSQVWSSDLRTLFENAKERFGDVSWEVGREGEDDEDEDENDHPVGFDEQVDDQTERIWGHKAMIYARAPPAFQARYFPPVQPRANSPLGQLNPNLNLSSSSTYLSSSSLQIPSHSSHYPFSSGNDYNAIPSSWSNNSKLGQGLTQTPSQISLASNFSSASTIRPPLRLRVGVTPQMFKAELEWLYTGEGMGEVVEWLNDRETRPGGGGLGLGLGTDGEGGEWGKIEGSGGAGSKTERLRNDLVYMWRSKLYSDVKIVLPLSTTRDPSAPLDTVSDDPSSSSTTATFSTHKFILASRSPYFASLLLNPGGFKVRADLNKEGGGEIELPSPPFTPASLHFCLGYIYAGTLSFSNRSFDLQTAFQIHRSATYLQLSSLRTEIEARIVHKFCDSLPVSTSPSGSSSSLATLSTSSTPPPKLIARRVPRVWRFASAPDVAAKDLELRTREWIIVHWGECWGKEIGEVGKRERDSLVKDVLALLRPDRVVSFVRSIAAVRSRIEQDVRNGGAGGGGGSGLPATRGLKQSAWVDNLLGTMLEIEAKVKTVLAREFGAVVRSEEFQGLLEGRGFERHTLVKVVEDAVAVVGTSEGCREGARVYESLVGLLVQVQEETSEPSLAIGSDTRRLVESAAAETMKHLRRRWLQVREKGGFLGLPSYILKEISDGIDQPEEELLVVPLNPAPTRAPPRLSSSAPRSRITSDDASSLRSIILTRNAAKGTDNGRDSDSVSVASRISTTSRASVASRTTTASRSSVASASSSVVAPLKSSLSKPTIPRASSFGGSSTASSPFRTPILTLAKSSSAAMLSINPPPPLRSSAISSRASTSSLASASSRQSVSARTTPVTSPLLFSTRSTSSESGRRTVKSSQTLTKPLSRPASVASVRSTTSTLRKAPTPTPTPPVPKLPTAKSPILTAVVPRQRTTSSMSASSSRLVTPSVKPTSSPKPPLPTGTSPAFPPTKPHRRPPAAASAMSRSPVKAPPPPPVDLSAVSSSTPRARVLSSSSRLSTKTSSPDLKSATRTERIPKPLRRPSSVASIRSSNSGTPTTDSSRKAPPPPLPTSTSTPTPSPTPLTLTVKTPVPPTPSVTVAAPTSPKPTAAPLPLRKPRSSSTASSLPPVSHITPQTTPSFRTNLDLPPSHSFSSTRSSPSVPSSPTSHTNNHTSTNRPSGRSHPAAAFDPPKRPPPVRKVPSLPTFVVHALGSSLPILPSPGVTLMVGIPCIISITGGPSKRGRCRAFARYIGQLQGEKGPWIGVELDTSARDALPEVKGLNDGSFGGVRYFEIEGGAGMAEERAGGTRMRKMSSSGTSDEGGGGLFGGGGSMWGGQRRGSVQIGERSDSPGGGNEGGTTRGLFLRPNAVVWVEGAE